MRPRGSFFEGEHDRYISTVPYESQDKSCHGIWLWGQFTRSPFHQGRLTFQVSVSGISLSGVYSPGEKTRVPVL